MLTPAPRCTRRHTPRGSPAPNSTSPALPCLPLVHRNPAPYPLNSTKICFSFFFFFFSLHFEPLQDNVATVVPPRALGSPPEPLPLHPRRPRRLHNVLTPLPPPAPTIWGMETPRCLAARKPLPPPSPPTPLVPCKVLAPHLRHPSAPAPHPSSLASPHCRLRTAARKFAAGAHPFTARKPHPVAACIRPPSLQGVQSPAAPATSSRHANTCCIRHLTSHKLVLVVSSLYILYYCNEYIF